MVLEDGDISFVYIISESYLFSDLVDDLWWDAYNHCVHACLFELRDYID